MSLKYEPASELLHISVKWLFLKDVEVRNPRPNPLNPKP